MCFLQHLPAAAAAPPARSLRLGRGVSCRANATRPGQHPGQHPATPQSPSEHPGDGAERSSPARGLCKTSSQALTLLLRRFPVVRHLRAPCPPPWPCPHRARWVAALAPGLPSLLLSGRRAAAPRGRRWGRAGGSHQGWRPLFGAHPTPYHPLRGVPAAPSPRRPHSWRDVLPPRAPKPQPPFRAASLPRPAGGAGGRWPTTPRGCQGCPRPPCQALAGDSCSWDPAAPSGTGPMALGRAVLVLLVLSSLRAFGAEPPEMGLPRDRQWVWGAAEPLSLSRGKRDDSGQEPSATAVISSDKTDAASVPPPALGTEASLLRVPTPADPMDDSPEPELLLSSAAPAPSNNTILLRGLPVSTTAESLDETDSPDPDLLEDSVSPSAPSASASLLRGLAASSTADPMDETDPPDPDLIPSSAPAPSTEASRALVVPTTADLMDETDSPDPDLLPGSPSAPQKSITITTRSWLTSLIEEGTMTDGLDSSPSAGPRSTAPPALVLTTTGYKKPKKSGAPPRPTLPAPWDTTPEGTAAPWEPSGLMGKCLLAILLLGLVAATFLVSTGVLGALLWRRARTGQRRFSPTEMVCISSLLPDAEAAAGSRPVPARRHKLLVPDGSSEPDGDNLTLSSFLPEHS